MVSVAYVLYDQQQVKWNLLLSARHLALPLWSKEMLFHPFDFKTQN